MAKMRRFSATVEYLGGGAAIVALFDDGGEWAGAGRVEIRSVVKAHLYEAAYVHASRAAAVKGGTLDRFREVHP